MSDKPVLYYEIHEPVGANEAGNEDAPTLVLSSGLGGSANFWKPQLEALTKNFRVITYDHLGTSRSPAALPKGYSIADMADELLALLDSLDVTECHLIGHALGGLVGLELALKRPSMLTSLIPINAWSCPNIHSARCFNIRKSLLAAGDKAAFLQMQTLILYPPDWIVEHAEALQAEEAHMLDHFPDEANLLTRIEALTTFNIDDRLSGINTDSFIIANKDDLLVPWKCSQILAARLPCAALSVLDYGGHACTVTVPNIVNDLILTHLSGYVSEETS